MVYEMSASRAAGASAEATLLAWPVPARPTYRLFDAGSVAVACLIGSPIAGMTLVALNYKRLGDKSKAWTVFFGGFVATALAGVLGYALPQAASMPCAIALVYGARAVAQSLQGKLIEQHIERDGDIASRWTAFWVGMAFLLVLGGAIFGPLIVTSLKPHVQIGSKDNIYFSGSASKADAQAVGDALKTAGLLQDNGASVYLRKASTETSIGIVVKDGVWDEPEMVATFEEIVNRAAPAAGGFPVQMKLLDTHQSVKKQVEIGQVVVMGKDHLNYFGRETEAEAQALGKQLQAEGYFDGSGADVYLDKGAAGSRISFVVSNGTWDNADSVIAFQHLVRKVGPSVGGLPVTMRMMNPELVVEKELTVR